MGLLDRIWESRTLLGEKGSTAEQAAADIATALAKPKPPRFVRTGAQTRLALLGRLSLPGWSMPWVMCPACAVVGHEMMQNIDIDAESFYKVLPFDVTEGKEAVWCSRLPADVGLLLADQQLL